MTLVPPNSQTKRRARPTRASDFAPGDDGKPHPGRRMTEREFVAWVDDKTQAEWVDGEVVVMPPVSNEHDALGGWLRAVFQLFVEHHGLGRVKGPEFTVRLARQRRRRVPDLMFIAKARESLIVRNHFEGPPDLIVELVSPESTVRDWREKHLDYKSAGVSEYWVIDRTSRRVEVSRLGRNGKYREKPPVEDVYHSSVLPGFFLRRKWLLGSTRPPILKALKELGVEA